MVLNIIILLAVVGVVYLHYIQGFFSAVLSAACAAVAALLAVGHAEWAAATLLDGRYPEVAEGVLTAAIFCVVYIVLRIVLDKFVPDGVRVQLYAEKVGAALAGFVAAIFTVGTAAVAVQMLPFGSSIGMAMPVPTADQTTTTRVPRVRQNVQMTTQGALRDADALDADGDLSSLWIPVDAWLIGLTSYQSEVGALAGEASLAEVNPAPLKASFGQRLGVPVGGRLTVLVGIAGQQQADLVSVHRLEPPVPQVDGEFERLAREFEDRATGETFTPAGAAVVVRVSVARGASDDDNIFRFSPAGVPVVFDGRLHYPVGTMEGDTLVRHRIDDPLAIDFRGDAGDQIDLVYDLPAEALAGETIAEGALLSLKRYGRLPLGGARFTDFEPNPNSGVARKQEVLETLAGETPDD